MKIKYRHASNPKQEKVHDTVKARKNTNCLFKAKHTQEEYDKEELARFERNVQEGLVLSYEVLEEGSDDNG